MKNTRRLILSVTILFLLSGNAFQRIDYRKGISNNVCKTLKDNVLVYFIFVDSNETAPWTEYDIRTTIDSLDIAIRWLEMQARNYNQALTIRKDYYIGDEFTTIKKALPGGTVTGSLSTNGFTKGLAELNLWADNIAKKAGSSLNIISKDGLPEIRNPKNKERLVAYLRDTYQVESVALLFLLNNYFRNDISVAVNTLDNDDVEFAIVSYKYPSVVAHNILHLFGAADLHKSDFRRSDKKVLLAGEFFPNDIMQDPYARNINDVTIGEFTRYLIGWDADTDPRFHPLFTDRAVFF